MLSHTEVLPQQLVQFRQQIELLGHVPDEDFAELAAILHFKKCRKKEIILSEGQVCKQFYFILQGAIRAYSVHQGKEVNIEFFFENEVASDFYSLHHETPSKIYLEALEPCKLLTAAKADYFHIFNESMPLTSAIMHFFQNMFFEEEAHSTSFKSLTPEERYRYVMEHQPQLIQRVPITHLASYLGISRETVSRIRKRF